jgi:ATP-dependent Clp protease ATP-binding subunit ClpA
VHLAREEAAAGGASHLASEHLLLGVLRSGGGTTAALEADGITVQAARRYLRARNGTGRDGKEKRGGSARAVLSTAGKIARARRARYVEPEHIVLAALFCADGGARRAITALGLTPAAVRARLGC